MATTLLASLTVLLPVVCVVIIAPAPLRGMDSKTMMAKILEKVNEFCGDHPRSDDITLMIIRTG